MPALCAWDTEREIQSEVAKWKSRDTLSILSWIKYIWVSRLLSSSHLALFLFSQTHHVLSCQDLEIPYNTKKKERKCWTNRAAYRCRAPAAAQTQRMRTWTTMCRVAFTSNRFVLPINHLTLCPTIAGADWAIEHGSFMARPGMDYGIGGSSSPASVVTGAC